MNGLHGFCFTLSTGLFQFTSSPLLTSWSIIHSSQSSVNWSCVALHCIHQCPAMDSFQEPMPGRSGCLSQILRMGVWVSCIPGELSRFGQGHWNSTTRLPISLCFNRFCWNVAITSSPWVNLSNIFSLSNHPVSFWQISSHTDTLKSILLSSQNWNAVLPWSLPTTIWTRATSNGSIDWLNRCYCK